MSDYAVAQLDEIDELSDGRCPWRPVRHHFGITSFGVNALTAQDAGDRIINEHDESEEQTCRRSSTSSSRAARGSSSTASGWMRPPARLSSPVPASSGRRSPRSRGRRSSRSAARRERPTSRTARRSGCRSTPSTSRASTPRRPTAGASWSRPILSTRRCSTTSRAARASRADDRRRQAPPARNRPVGAVPLVRQGRSDFDPIRDDARSRN